jgi:ABC-type nitrate/sulfonate/bicarbonate transport system substrate-binding protein
MKTLSTIFSILLLTLALGCREQRTPSETTSVKTSIRIAHAPVVLNLPIFLAQDRGLFASNSLTADLKVFTSANDMINAVVAGQVDAVTGVSLVPILNLEAQNPGTVRVVLHSRMDDIHPFDGIIVKSDSPLRELGDLKGRKLGLFPGTTALNFMKAFLKQKGLNPDEVTFVQLPPASHLSALESGAVDALLAYEPTLTTALQQGARRIHGSIYAAMLNPSPISAAIIARRFERENPEAADRFVRALDQSIQQIRSNPAQARLSLTNHTQIPLRVANEVNLIADTLSTEVDRQNLQAFIELLRQIGELPKPVSAESLLAPTK